MKKPACTIPRPLAVLPVFTALALLHMAFCGIASGQTDVTNEVQVLIKVAFMGKAVSNELVAISTNVNIASDFRQYAANVLANHDTAGTNEYNTLEGFIAGWSITNEPPVSSNLISTMKQTLEYGISGKARLAVFAGNTNMPVHLRQIADKMLYNLGGRN